MRKTIRLLLESALVLLAVFCILRGNCVRAEAADTPVEATVAVEEDGFVVVEVNYCAEADVGAENGEVSYRVTVHGFCDTLEADVTSEDAAMELYHEILHIKLHRQEFSGTKGTYTVTLYCPNSTLTTFAAEQEAADLQSQIRRQEARTQQVRRDLTYYSGDDRPLWRIETDSSFTGGRCRGGVGAVTVFDDAWRSEGLAFLQSDAADSRGEIRCTMVRSVLGIPVARLEVTMWVDSGGVCEVKIRNGSVFRADRRLE